MWCCCYLAPWTLSWVATLGSANTTGIGAPLFTWVCEQSEGQNHTDTTHAYEKPLSTFLEYLCKNLCLNKCCPLGCLFGYKLKEKGMFACIGISCIFPVLLVFCRWIFKKENQKKKKEKGECEGNGKHFSAYTVMVECLH